MTTTTTQPPAILARRRAEDFVRKAVLHGCIKEEHAAYVTDKLTDEMIGLLFEASALVADPGSASS